MHRLAITASAGWLIARVVGALALYLNFFNPFLFLPFLEMAFPAFKWLTLEGFCLGLIESLFVLQAYLPVAG